MIDGVVVVSTKTDGVLSVASRTSSGWALRHSRRVSVGDSTSISELYVKNQKTSMALYICQVRHVKERARDIRGLEQPWRFSSGCDGGDGGELNIPILGDHILQ